MYRIVILLWLVFWGATFALAAADPTSIRASYLETKTLLNTHFTVYGDLEAKPEDHVEELFRKEWTLLGDWAASYLNVHPTASAGELTTSLEELDPEIGIEVIELGGHAYLVSTVQGGIGNVFIVANYGGTFWPIWNIADVSDSKVRGWNAAALNSDSKGPPCSASSIGKLSPDARGRIRFYIDGVYLQGAGTTMEGQFSIWLWDGSTASALLAKDFAFMIDSSVEQLRIQGDTISLRTKEEFKTFFSSGSGEEKKADWIISVQPGAVIDLGSKAVDPELDVVDDLFYRIERRLPASELASESVVADLIDQVPDVRKDLAAHKQYVGGLGMLSLAKVTRLGQRATVLFGTDDFGPYEFTVITRNGRPFVSSMQPVEQPGN